MIALSKGIASGYSPLGAMVTSGKMVDPVLDSGGFIHGFSYAGNPLACAAGLAVLEEIERQNLLTQAEQKGNLLKGHLEDLMQRFPFIGDVRGKGLLLAVEFVADRETMEPLHPELNAHNELVEMAYERGLIIYSRRTRGGRIGDHFLICPPLIIEEEQIDELLGIFTGTFGRICAEAQTKLQFRCLIDLFKISATLKRMPRNRFQRVEKLYLIKGITVPKLEIKSARDSVPSHYTSAHDAS